MKTSIANNKEAVKTLQKVLLGLGQTLHKFGVDGDLGNETKTAIDNLNFPEYVKIALKEIGAKEIKGSVHNPRVVEYQKTTSGKYSDDETPWCGAFISWVMKTAGIQHNIKIPERAKEWKAFGVQTLNPVVGSIAIKDRVGGGHVCIVIGGSINGRLLCVGGNQNDEVNIAQYKRSDFTDFRILESNLKSYETLANIDMNVSSNVKES